MRKAVYLNEVPADIRRYPLLGRGQTALVFRQDRDTVLVVTRDPAKVEWLTQPWGLELGRVVRELEGAAHPLGGRLYVIEMPFLRPLSPANRRKVRRELKLLERARHETGARPRDPDYWERVYAWFNAHAPDSLLLPALEFAVQYGAEFLEDDLRLANFAEDARGRIVVLDPFVAREIVDFIHRRVRAAVARLVQRDPALGRRVVRALSEWVL